MIVKEKNSEGFLDLRICDNLELMAEIKDNTIDLIYCDILYGTGRRFADYQDLKPIRSEIESHYIPRIKEMHRILKPTGSIYLQMDYRISHWIRCLMDDVFGYDNFRREIIWDIEVLSGYKTLAKNWILGHQNILYYSKSDKYIFNKLKQSHTEKYLSSFNKIDKDGRSFQVAHGRKIYKDVVIDKGKPFGDVWKDIKSFQQQPTAMERKLYKYDMQKPKALIERIVKASSNEGDLVADFYSGSFTTAEVCKDLKRNFIGCDINPNCFEKAKERGLFSFTDLPINVD